MPGWLLWSIYTGVKGTSLAAYVFKLLRVFAWAKSAALIKIKDSCRSKVEVQKKKQKNKGY